MRHLEKPCLICGDPVMESAFGYVHVDGIDHGHGATVRKDSEEIWQEDDSTDIQSWFDEVVKTSEET